VLLQLSTKLLDSGKLKDSLKLVYDFQNRFGEYGLVVASRAVQPGDRCPHDVVRVFIIIDSPNHDVVHVLIIIESPNHDVVRVFIIIELPNHDVVRVLQCAWASPLCILHCV
jgi:hypothetical protein